MWRTLKLNQTVNFFLLVIFCLDSKQGEELNRYGEVYIKKHPQLNVKVVDGSSLAVAVVLNSIPKGTTEVVLRGKLTKVAYTLAFTLCQKGIRVSLPCDHGVDSMKNLCWVT